MADRNPIVFVVLPPAVETAEWAVTYWKAIEKAAKGLGYETAVYRGRRVRVHANGDGRTTVMIDPWEAKKIYRDAHRRGVAVVQFADVHVLRNPRGHPSQNNSIPLGVFTRHKTYFHKVEGPRPPAKPLEPVSTFVDGFHAWLDHVGCEDSRDPRCLPLHSFSDDLERFDLGSNDGRESFARRHGTPATLRDDAGMKWGRPRGGAMHGREVLSVAGMELPVGFHWDVLNESNPGSLASINEVWHFKKNAYANVSPDATIRQGQRAGVRATKAFVSPRPSGFILDAEVATPVVNKLGGRRRSRGRG